MGARSGRRVPGESYAPRFNCTWGVRVRMENWQEDDLPGNTPGLSESGGALPGSAGGLSAPMHDPNEVTVQIDGLGRHLAGESGGAADGIRTRQGIQDTQDLTDKPVFVAGNPMFVTGTSMSVSGNSVFVDDKPVFVDETGRRSRRYRRIGGAVGLFCAVYAVVIVATLVSGNSSAPWLPVPDPKDEQPATKVDTPEAPAEPVVSPRSPSSSWPSSGAAPTSGAAGSGGGKAAASADGRGRAASSGGGDGASGGRGDSPGRRGKDHDGAPDPNSAPDSDPGSGRGGDKPGPRPTDDSDRPGPAPDNDRARPAPGSASAPGPGPTGESDPPAGPPTQTPGNGGGEAGGGSGEGTGGEAPAGTDADNVTDKGGSGTADDVRPTTDQRAPEVGSV
ncbi:hypothetical protein GCM10010252_17280 [Streptomyces aureoverticillatus]|nr:hypothetical protein GCM10010252_17280 [Streptomyces aureoverticillatus]